MSFGDDEQRHGGGPSRRNEGGDRAAHAVPHQAAVAKFQGIDEGDDRPGVILARIAEVERLVAVAMTEQVDQERPAPAERRLNGRGQQLAGRGALPAVHPQQGRIIARHLEIAEEGAIGREVDRLHAYVLRGALGPSACPMCRLIPASPGCPDSQEYAPRIPAANLDALLMPCRRPS